MEYKRFTKRTAKGLKLKKGRKYVELFADKELTRQALIHFAELEDKIENGTLIELPCKVGDKVYCVPSKKEYEENIRHMVERFNVVSERQISAITIRQRSIGVRVGGFPETSYAEKEFGKTLFFTREEAEAKLEELQK